MRNIRVAISTESRGLRAIVVSVAVLAALVWRMLGRGERFFSSNVGLACIFVAAACFAVWGVQRLLDRRWPWIGVFAGVVAFSLGFIWATVAVLWIIRPA
jgi:hypothetical protein